MIAAEYNVNCQEYILVNSVKTGNIKPPRPKPVVTNPNAACLFATNHLVTSQLKVIGKTNGLATPTINQPTKTIYILKLKFQP